MKETHGDVTPLVSRRQVLSGATYGLGATLLFTPALADKKGKGNGPPRAESPERNAEGRVRPAAQRGGPRFEFMPLSGDGLPRSVCRGARGVVVVGSDEGGSPISWLNVGDVHWHRHRLTDPASGHAEVWGVTAYRDAFVAVGSALSPVAGPAGAATEDMVPTASSRRRPVVWRTDDGAQWDGMILDEVEERHAQLVAVSSTGGLMVAVGSTLDSDGVQGNGAFALASSDGGATWRRSHIASQHRSLSEGSFTGVAQLDGTWVATSTDIGGSVVWSSPNGLSWSTIPGSATQFRRVTLHGVAAHGGRVYVAGTRLTDHTPLFLASKDRCRSWQPLRNGPVALAEPDAMVTDVTVMSGQLVVIGMRSGQPLIEGGIPDVVAD